MKKIVIASLLILSIIQIVKAEKPELVIQSGHSGRVKIVALSDDNRFIYSLGENKAILWDAQTGKQLNEYKDYFEDSFYYKKYANTNANVDTISISNCDTNGFVQIQPTSKVVKEYRPLFTADCKYLISNHSLNNERLERYNKNNAIDIETGRKVIVPEIYDNERKQEIPQRILPWSSSIIDFLYIEAFNHYEELITKPNYYERKMDSVINCNKKYQIRYHFNNSNQICGITAFDTLKLHFPKEYWAGWKYFKQGINDFVLSKDKSFVVTGHEDGSCGLWDAKSGKLIREFVSHSSGIEYVNNKNEIISLKNYKGYKFQIDLNNSKNFQNHIEYPKDSIEVMTLQDSLVIEYKYEREKSYKTKISPYINRILATDISLKRNEIACGFDKSILLWNIIKREPNRIFRGHDGQITSLEYNPNSNVIVSGSSDSVIIFWNADDLSISSKLQKIYPYILGLSNKWEYFACPQLKDLILKNCGSISVYKNYSSEQYNEITLASHFNIENSSFPSDYDQFSFYNNQYIMTGEQNGEVNFYNIHTGQKDISLIPLDSTDWVAIMSDGHFDSSPNGMNLIHYVKDLKPVPLSAFYDKYYTPGLLKMVLNGEYKPANDFKDFLFPPSIEIKSPEKNSSMNKDLLQIQMMIKDEGGGIDEVSIYQNGKLIEETELGFETGKIPYLPYNFNVSLLPGKNEFTIAVYSTDRTEYVEEFYLELDNSIIPKFSAESELFIFSVGINDYKNTSYNLDYAKPDAQAVLQEIRKKTGKIFKNVHHYEIYDQDAVKNNIDKIMKEIAKKAKPSDTFVFYYAGHGVMTEANEGNPEEYILVLHDILRMYKDHDFLVQKGISSKELKVYCKNIKAQKQLIIMDACQSGAALKDFAFRGAIEEKAIQQLAKNTGSVVLASAGLTESATEYRKLGHGLFTYALLLGLRGEADNGDGKITVYELSAFLNDKVMELTEELRGKPRQQEGIYLGRTFRL